MLTRIVGLALDRMANRDRLSLGPYVLGARTKSQSGPGTIRAGGGFGITIFGN